MSNLDYFKEGYNIVSEACFEQGWQDNDENRDYKPPKPEEFNIDYGNLTGENLEDFKRGIETACDLEYRNGFNNDDPDYKYESPWDSDDDFIDPDELPQNQVDYGYDEYRDYDDIPSDDESEYDNYWVKKEKI